MAGRPALLTQAEVKRVIRAAQQAGAATVVVKPDGSILISLSPTHTEADDKSAVAIQEIVL